jgi:hypothetical protein
MPAYPEDSYLQKIGRLVYGIASLEWLVLGELPRHQSLLPPQLGVGGLAGKTTGKIGSELTAAANDLEASPVQHFLAAAGEQLSAVATMRNHLLHARPATVEEKQRLYRWRLNRGAQFPITDDWLQEQISDIERRVRELDRLRMEARD